MAVAGKVAITPSTENGGAWSANVTYDRLVAVKHNNNLYISRKTVANVEPPNNEFWFLALEGFRGDDIEDIIDGTTQVGNAKTLDGHGGEYFAPKTDLANYLPLTGGVIRGSFNQKVNTESFVTRQISNSKRNVYEQVAPDGTFYLHDGTNGKNIFNSNLDGTTTFNGTASGNLPLDGGTLKRTDRRILTLDNIHESGSGSAIGFSVNGTFLGEIGILKNGSLVFNNSVVEYGLLHTGNKPTGTYTGNGSATSRTINTGGIGKVLLIYGYGGWWLVSPLGAIQIPHNSGSVTVIPQSEMNYNDGVLTIAGTGAYNNSGTSYSYECK